VRCALRAAKTADVKLRCYAIEKNPNAVVTLKNAGEQAQQQQLARILSCVLH
jgi:hypothetical protein